MELSPISQQVNTSHRYFIRLCYDGTAYHGWQRQPNGDSVQEQLETALSTFLQKNITVVGAGRTDAGVHAKLMVAHFDFNDELDTAWATEKLNNLLPQDIAVYNIREVKPDAHARFDATSRTYKYYLSFRKDPFIRQSSWRIYRKLDFEAMNRAAAALYRYTDFTSFSKLHTDNKTNICNIFEAHWQQETPTLWIFTIRADRFLRNMVRAIVGTMMEVGKGKMSLSQFCQVIEAKDRCLAGTSAPAHALFLTDIEYPKTIYIK